MINYILTFFYSFAHTAGTWVMEIIGKIVPADKIPWHLVDPVGYLAIITLLLILVEVARKVAWVLVAVAWVFLLIRVAAAMVG
jgi:hypothetical protein